MNKYYNFNTFSDAYKAILENITNDPEFENSPRGLKIKELTNIHIDITDPTRSMYTNSKRSSQFKYIAAELVWYFSASNDLSFIEKFAKFWINVANPDNTLNSAYGNLLFNQHYDVTQWKWAYDSLVKDKDSRQAILHFNMPIHQKNDNKDFVCTMYGIFQIRNNELNFTIHMRSNDVILGLPTDIAFFCLLQQQMLKLLNESVYPDLKLGKYSHIVNSLHLYEKNFNLVNDMLANEFESVEFTIGENNLVDSEGKCSSILSNINNLLRYDKLEFFKGSQDSLISWIIDKLK